MDLNCNHGPLVPLSWPLGRLAWRGIYPPKNLKSLSAILSAVLACCLLLIGSLAHAVSTTYNGVTVNWDAGLDDLRLDMVLDLGTGSNAYGVFYYESKKLAPDGNLLPITMTLPAAYAGNGDTITLSPAGGTYKTVTENRTYPGYLAYDLIFPPAPPTYVNYSASSPTFTAFYFSVEARSGPDINAPSVNFYIYVSLDKSMRRGLDYLLDQLGSELDNIFTEFDKTSCSSIGFPTHSVNTSTLNLVVQDTEFSVQSLGPRLTSTRTWNSVPTRAGMFGNGWSFPYESTLKKSCGGAQVTSAGGQTLWYKANLCPDTPLVYPVSATAPAGNLNKLTYASGDYWLLERNDTRETLRYDLAAGGLYRLTSITDKNGNQLVVAYNGDGAIDHVTDAVGRAISFTYDGNGRPVGMMTPGNLQAIFAYDVRGNLIRTVDLYGTEILYQYDLDNYMTAMSYAGKTISYTYDTSGGWKHVATVTDAEGQVRKYQGYDGSSSVSYTSSRITDARGNITTYTRDSAGRTTGVISPSGFSTAKVYTGGLPVTERDQRERTTFSTYDARGNLTKRTDPTGHWASYTYDADDKAITKSNDLGETWTNAYDAKGNLTSVTSPLGKTTLMAYDSKGQVISITDGNGQATLFAYDTFGNLQDSTDPLGKVTTFGYASTGLDPSSKTDPNGNSSLYAYDQNRRLTRVTHPDATHRDISYDACARTGTTDENGHSTTYTRDKMLREVARTEPSAVSTSKAYDGNGNLVAVTDPLNHRKTMIYDSDNQLASQTNALGGTITYTHEGNGNTTGVQDERGNLTTFVFDANNRVISTTDPLNRTVRFTRDAVGRVVQSQNARGGLLGMAYNADGQLTSKTFDSNTASYGYDNAANLRTFTDTTGTTSYTYSARNQVTGIAYPDGKSVGFTYDDAGNLLATSYPGGPTLSYTRSSRNWIQSMQWGASSASFTYDAVGNLLSETRSNGTTSAHLYDANDRTTKVEHSAGANTIARMQYTRDAMGNTVAETSTLPISVALQSSDSIGVYDSANQIQAFKEATYSYDLDGNIISTSGAAGFAGLYDQLNRLVRMTVGGVQSDYVYDAVGNKVRATRGAVTTQYYYDHTGKLLFEADGSGTILNYYLYRDSRMVAMSSAAGANYFYHHDKNGNTVAMTNASGTVVNAYAYTPYGEIAGSTETVANRFKYVGSHGVVDEGGGIYFMKNRYYDASAGRFLQKDPIGFAGGQSNLFAYVGGNPVGRIDPAGTGWIGWLMDLIGFKQEVDESLKRKAAYEAHIDKVGILGAVEDGSLDAYNQARGQNFCTIAAKGAKLASDAAINVATTGANSVAGGGLMSGAALSAGIDALKGAP